MKVVGGKVTEAEAKRFHEILARRGKNANQVIKKWVIEVIEREDGAK